jgi:hypothetical protein
MIIKEYCDTALALASLLPFSSANAHRRSNAKSIPSWKMSTTPKTGALEEIILEIYRETGAGNFLNRVCKDAATGVVPATGEPNAETEQETKYYCEADLSHYLTIHKGDLFGPIIASAPQVFIGKDGTTVVLLTRSTGKEKIELEHMHHTLPLFHGNTFFQVGDKKVHWKGQSALVEDQTGVCLAVFKPKFFETKTRKLGTLLVTAHGLGFIDMIVISALVEQERLDEAELEVDLLRRCSLLICEEKSRAKGK